MRTLTLLAITAFGLFAESTGTVNWPFVLPVAGCPMSHCDPAMSDRARMRAPASIASTWTDANTASADTGLGCSSNGRIAVCSIGPSPDGTGRSHVKAYDAAGNVLWTSGDTLNASAWTSAPMVGRWGGVIAADDTSIVRFSPAGEVLWRTPTSGGKPISPTLTADGTIVLATLGGPVSAYDSTNGQHLGTLELQETLGGLSGRFETMNTPGARGNRVYVSTEFKMDDGSADPNHHARLYAIDVDRTQPDGERLRVAWYFEFGARSGASPLVIGDLIVFDGDRLDPAAPAAPRFFAVRDKGAAPELVWQYSLGGPGVASAALDPRGGLWVFALGDTRLLRLAEADGSVLQTIDASVVSGVPGARPWSGMTIAFSSSNHPVMLVAARTTAAPYVMAFDLTTESALWTRAISNDVYGDLPRGQWPILAGPDGERVVVFTTRNGVRALSGPVSSSR